MNNIISFEEELKKYLLNTDCDDLIPITSDNITCHDIVTINQKKTIDYLSVYNEFNHILDSNNNNKALSLCDLLTKHNYCRFSCRQCVNKKDIHPSINPDPIVISNDFNYIPVLISSDWHVEPWYEPSTETTVARYSYANYNNMWECFDSTYQIDCILNGLSDPPIDLIESHILSYESLISSMINSSKRFINNVESDSFHGLLFYGGDTQAHDYTSPYIGDCDEAVAIGDLMTRVADLLTSYWDPLDIFLTPGNNDGPHNSIFSSDEGDVYSRSEAWAEVIISSGIVNNNLNLFYDYAYTSPIDDSIFDDDDIFMTQTEFFSHTGYYIKEIDENNKYINKTIPLYVISYNTNLGLTNIVQQNALLKDLEYVSNNNGGVYILGHHPEVTKNLIPSKYQYLIKGMFSGHTHEAASTNKKLFTQVPAISQAADVTGYYIGKIYEDNNYEIIVSKSKDLIECNNDLSIGLPASIDLWS
uniref:Calcineurin-like phosphoesterase domain-containing protein n=1 Tax=Chromulina nebulosa TaxID=96789 RepID=A0A7S0XCU9_9STRA